MGWDRSVLVGIVKEREKDICDGMSMFSYVCFYNFCILSIMVWK